MPESARITFRLTQALEPLVAERVRQGSPVSDIVREALEQYFGLRQPGGPPQGAVVSDSIAPVSDALSDVVSALSATVADMRLVVSDIRDRLEHFEGRLDVLSAGVQHRPTPRLTAPPEPATAPIPEAPSAEVPRRQTPRQTQPATAPRQNDTPIPAYIQRIAEVAAEYDKLTLVELSQLLYDRDIYRTRDRKTKAEKPVNKGTLQKWLEQARQAGVL